MVYYCCALFFEARPFIARYGMKQVGAPGRFRFFVSEKTEEAGCAGPEPAAAESGYMLRSWEGYVGVFCPPDADTPVTVTDVRVRDLPLSDRLALAGGIAAEDHGQVVQILEDFSP